MAYRPNPIQEYKGREQVVVGDEQVRGLLQEVLRELRALNVQLSLVTDQQVSTNKELN